MKRGLTNLPVIILSILVIITLSVIIYFIWFQDILDLDNPNDLENVTRMDQIDDAVRHGVDQPFCSDECSARGLKRCFGNGYKICGNYEEDSCYEWSSLRRCSSEEECNAGICVEIGEEPSQEETIRYDFDEIEILSASTFNITKTNRENTWADNLKGNSDKLTVTYSILNLKKDGEIIINEEFLKVEGQNGEKKFLHNSKSYDYDNTGNKIQERVFFWSAKQLIGDYVVKDKTLPVYSASLIREFDESGNVYSTLFSFSDEGLTVDENAEIYDWEIVEEEEQIFQPSEILYDISEKTEKPDQYYCSYDLSRNKVTIIIKENGVYDAPDLINKFDEYFTAVKIHLDINNVGVKKFGGSTIEELDNFIETLVKDEYVGYIILIGADLPITTSEDNLRYLVDLHTINNIYSYVERENTNCIDVAISIVVAPQTKENQKEFVSSVFSNFIDYHKNIGINEFSEDILIIEWDNNLDSSIGGAIGDDYHPDNFIDYNTIYFYPTIYILNSDFNTIREEMKNKHLILKYHVHGSADSLGLGLVTGNDSDISIENIYNDIQEVLDFYETNGQISLFVDNTACYQNFISRGSSEFCCWPQVWLKTKVWSMFMINGDPYHHRFERWLYNEKVIGKALRKTYHNQNFIFGDILGTFP